jgi:hypothetical protein
MEDANIKDDVKMVTTPNFQVVFDVCALDLNLSKIIRWIAMTVKKLIKMSFFTIKI